MHLITNTSSNSHFANVPHITQARNAFSISERHLTTAQFDNLIPIYHKFTYPGDTISIEQKVMARLQTQGWVLYDDLWLDLHAWFVPHRLIQDNWARFQFNAQPAGPTQNNSALTTPAVNLALLPSNQFGSKTLYDYFGYPTLVSTAGSTEHINNYLPRAYNRIYNDNYRDQNFQDAIPLDLHDGPDDPTKYIIRKRGKRHDKFTSALASQQKGTAPSIGFASSAPVTISGVTVGSPVNLSNAPLNLKYNTTVPTQGGYIGSGTGYPSPANGLLPATLNATADLSLATGFTVNQLRQSVAVQHLLEADARGGTRDVESIANRWGVQVPDYRLQRPEWLGGQTFDFDGHIVPQTSETSTSPQGTLTQFSQAMTSLSVNHSFVEHGSFIILLSLRSNITYQQGLQRDLSYKTRFDFYQPEFANLGEVAMKNKEIFFAPEAAATNNLTFGFNEYGYELRYGENRVSAEMRSNFAQSLDMKHMADDYATLPTLGPAWIQSNTAISRNIAVAVATVDPIELNCLVTGSIARTLPMYSVPGLDRL